MPRAAARGPQRWGDAHDDFAARLEELCTRMRTAPGPDLLPAWNAFVEALQVHLAFEEDILFPAFAHQNIASSKVVQALVAEHAAARQLAEEIGEQLARAEFRPSTLEVFTDLLREHAEAENAHVYSWRGSGATR